MDILENVEQNQYKQYIKEQIDNCRKRIAELDAELYRFSQLQQPDTDDKEVNLR